jgi:hypothetical protein
MRYSWLLALVLPVALTCNQATETPVKADNGERLASFQSFAKQKNAVYRWDTEGPFLAESQIALSKITQPVAFDANVQEVILEGGKIIARFTDTKNERGAMLRIELSESVWQSMKASQIQTFEPCFIVARVSESVVIHEGDSDHLEIRGQCLDFKR